MFYYLWEFSKKLVISCAKKVDYSLQHSILSLHLVSKKPFDFNDEEILVQMKKYHLLTTC